MSSRIALGADRDRLALTLAEAFLDDPMVEWLTGDADPATRPGRSIDAFFAPAIDAAFRCGHTYVAGDFEAVSVWSPPDVEIFGEAEGAALAGGLAGACGADAIDRLLALAELTQARHPHDEPHFYLFLLGAAVHGRGAGARAIAPVLDRCDADGIGAYLESSSARNISFYERAGFEVVWEAAPEGGPTFRGMWRRPRTRGSSASAPASDRA